MKKPNKTTQVILGTIVVVGIILAPILLSVNGDLPTASAEPKPENVVEILTPNTEVKNWKYQEVYRNDVKYGVYQKGTEGIYVVNLTREELEVQKLRMEILQLESK